jgi:hypothetical protein
MSMASSASAIIKASGETSIEKTGETEPRKCSFERIYFCTDKSIY